VAKLFFSYAHEDEALRNELAKHLAVLQRQGHIEMWHDRRITAGQPLDRAIRLELDQVDVVLFLVNSDFLDSDYCNEVEVARALARQARGEATVIPVILRPCDWRDAPFGHLLAAPKDAKPVTTWPSRDEAFLDVVRAIKAALAERRATPGVGRPAPPGPELAVDRPKVLSRNLDVARTLSEREKERFPPRGVRVYSNLLPELADSFGRAAPRSHRHAAPTARRRPLHGRCLPGR
jgi:TIR domain